MGIRESRAESVVYIGKEQKKKVFTQQFSHVRRARHHRHNNIITLVTTIIYTVAMRKYTVLEDKRTFARIEPLLLSIHALKSSVGLYKN